MDNDAIRRKWDFMAGICSRQKDVWWLGRIQYSSLSSPDAFCDFRLFGDGWPELDLLGIRKSIAIGSAVQLQRHCTGPWAIRV